MRHITLVLSLLLVVGGFARPMVMEVSAAERDAQALAKETSTYRALTVLQLTDDQKKALLSILTDQSTDLNAIRSAQEKALPDYLEAIKSLRTAVLANATVSADVKAAVRRAEAQYLPLQVKLDKTTTPERVTAIWKLFTTVQGARVYRLTAYGAEDDQTFITRKAGTLNKKFKRPDDFLKRLYGEYGLRGTEIDAALKVVQPTFDEWQKLSLDDAYAQREVFLKRLLALPDQEILSIKPDERTVQNITRYLLNQYALHKFNPEVPLPVTTPVFSTEALQLTTDVQLLNLVNILSLTPEQTRALLGLEHKAKDEYSALDLKRSDLATKATPVLQQIRDLADKDQSITPALKTALAGIEKDRQSLNAQETKVDAGYVGDLSKLLTTDQVAIISHFDPSLVPPQILTGAEHGNPLSDTTGIEHELARLRALPADKLADAQTKFTAGIRKQFERKHYKPAAIDPILALIPDIVKQARALDDAAFLAQVADMAKPITASTISVTGHALDQRIINYLLHPNLIPIFEGRLAALPAPVVK